MDGRWMKGSLPGRVLGLVVVVVLALAALPGRAQADTDRLVTADWLRAQLGQPDLLVLDASPGAVHRARHIPGAVNVDLFAQGPHEPTRAQMEQRMRAWGLSARHRVVLVDAGGTYLATRLYFDLVHHGFPERQVHLLDGGMARWIAAGGPVTAEPTPAPPPGDWRISLTVESVRSRLPEFLQATGDRRQHVVDALDARWYHGETAWFDRAGHVPHAVMWPVADFFNTDKTFKSPEEIRRMMAWLGIRDDQPVHTYCGGGIAASVPFFALRHIVGHRQVKLFLESQLGWLQDERDLPMWTYARPHLVRDTAWLKTWGGKAMRQYGLQRATLVDLRPPEAYGQAHVPLSVNVPLAEVRRRLGRPDELARLFADAGLDPAHELVVSADAGVDAAAALGAMALRLAGYERVSVYADTIDQWAAAGHEVERAAARAAGSSQAAGATAVPSARREGVVLTGVAAAVPARVFLASGRAPFAPSAAPGRVLHLSAAALLTPDGRPRPAHEIWRALVLAGVPRYAELVTVAEDPADAALNQLLLQLMGFADVKVWLR
jgi:3-mercaptopyruvate sulfurtransferase SseA